MYYCVSTLTHVFILYICIHVIEGTMPLSAKDTIRKFNVKLLEQLPLDNPIFFGMAKAADLFPLGTAADIEAKPTRAEKVTYFLQHVVEPGANDYLPKLLKVMKESKNTSVIKLADELQVAMEQGTQMVM